ncbi:MAG: tRNA (guanine-N1)-methyltransferase [Owenweeksia sp.]
MKKTFLLASLLLWFCHFNQISAQDNGASLDSGSLKEQFKYLVDKSNDYQDYKVIRKTLLTKMQIHITDSLTQQAEMQVRLQNTIEQQSSEINNLQQELTTTQDSLTKVTEEKNSMALLGVATEKNTYRFVMWGLVGLLTALVLIFLLRFRNSSIASKQAKENLEDVEEEFADYKKRSLEREQKLRRQLQDEINKQRGVN